MGKDKMYKLVALVTPVGFTMSSSGVVTYDAINDLGKINDALTFAGNAGFTSVMPLLPYFIGFSVVTGLIGIVITRFSKSAISAN